MASWELVRRRIRRPRISRRNGNQMVSRRTCTPVLPGKEVLSQRDLLLPSRLQLPSQRRPHAPTQAPPAAASSPESQSAAPTAPPAAPADTTSSPAPALLPEPADKS